MDVREAVVAHTAPTLTELIDVGPAIPIRLEAPARGKPDVDCPVRVSTLNRDGVWAASLAQLLKRSEVARLVLTGADQTGHIGAISHVLERTGKAESDKIAPPATPAGRRHSYDGASRLRTMSGRPHGPAKRYELCRRELVSLLVDSPQSQDPRIGDY